MHVNRLASSVWEAWVCPRFHRRALFLVWFPDFIEGVKIVSGPATYLLWLDVSIVSANSQELADYIRKETGLIVSPGIIYRGNGNKFLRLNLASPISMVEDGISRLITGIKKYSKNS